MRTIDTAEALRLAELASERIAACPLDAGTEQVLLDATAMLRSLVAEVERLRTAANTCGSGAGCLSKDARIEHLEERLSKWTSALTAVMPADYKAWHEADADELPGIAADLIRAQREDRDLGWEMAARAQAAAAAVPEGYELVTLRAGNYGWRYAVQQSAKLLRDIDRKGLQSGGEQYPNALNLHDMAQRLDALLADPTAPAQPAAGGGAERR